MKTNVDGVFQSFQQYRMQNIEKLFEEMSEQQASIFHGSEEQDSLLSKKICPDSVQIANPSNKSFIFAKRKDLLSFENKAVFQFNSADE